MICPICKGSHYQNLGVPYSNMDATQHQCSSCGMFIASMPAWLELQSMNNEERIKISVFTRQRNLFQNEAIWITSETVQENNLSPMISIPEILSNFPRRLSERIDRALISLAKMSSYTGAKVNLTLNDYPLLCPDTAEIGGALFMLQQLLNLNYVVGSANLPGEFQVSADGWNRVYELESYQTQSKQGFIAMAFASEYDEVWKAIAAAIENAGFTPFRVNQSDTNGKICDEIIAQIQRSRFVVADFTGQRNGVYFEAGYAMGLGIPVIWSCQASEIREGKLHFDTRQYNHIDWETPEELMKRLYNRIRVTIH